MGKKVSEFEDSQTLLAKRRAVGSVFRNCVDRIEGCREGRFLGPEQGSKQLGPRFVNQNDAGLMKFRRGSRLDLFHHYLSGSQRYLTTPVWSVLSGL